MKQDGLALRHVAKPLRADKEVVMAAVQQNGDALPHAAMRLRADEEIVHARPIPGGSVKFHVRQITTGYPLRAHK